MSSNIFYRAVLCFLPDSSSICCACVCWLPLSVACLLMCCLIFVCKLMTWSPSVGGLHTSVGKDFFQRRLPSMSVRSQRAPTTRDHSSPLEESGARVLWLCGYWVLGLWWAAGAEPGTPALITGSRLSSLSAALSPPSWPVSPFLWPSLTSFKSNSAPKLYPKQYIIAL